MSKLFPLIIFLSGFFADVCAQQRYADLKVTLKEPVPGDVIQVNNPFDVTVKLHNQGADTIRATDTLRFSLSFDTSVILFLVDTSTLDYIPETGIEIYPEDSVEYKFQFGVGTGWDTGFTNFCVKVIPTNSADWLADTATADNKGCVMMRITDPSLSVAQLPTGISSVGVYPNPATDVLNFKISGGSTGEPVLVVLTDVLGRTVIKEHSLSKIINLDVSALAEGLYGYSIITAKERFTGIVNIK